MAKFNGGHCQKFYLRLNFNSQNAETDGSFLFFGDLQILTRAKNLSVNFQKLTVCVLPLAAMSSNMSLAVGSRCRGFKIKVLAAWTMT